jgi:streptogramin lyase
MLLVLLAAGSGSAIAAGESGTRIVAEAHFAASISRTFARASRTAPSPGDSGIDDPRGITAGPDGALWFTNSAGNSIGQITTTGTVTTYTDPSIDHPVAITAGPDGTLWFTNGSDSIGQITTTGTVTTYTDPSIDYPVAITAGPDGALWFTNNYDSIGRITTTGQVTTYTDPSIIYPDAITAGPDGALWFTNSGNGGRYSIGRITTSGAITSYTDPSIDGPDAIAVGPDGALWFVNIGYGGYPSIGRITTSGQVTNYTDPSIYAPGGITVGPDGALWFTNTGSIGRITTSGQVTSYTSAGVSGGDITAGPDGALWFTNGSNNAIGQVTTTGQVTIYPALLVATPNPSGYGQSVTFTDTVSPSDGGGTVAFSADGTPISGCSGQPLSLVTGSSYQATCTASGLALGGHVVEATYSGDTQSTGSSATITQTVTPLSTATTLQSGTDPSTYGQAVTFTATVSPSDGQGTVSFSRGTGKSKIALCPAQSLSLIEGSYQASCTTSALVLGIYTITASYTGDTDYAPSSGTLTQTVNKTPTTTTLASSNNPSRYGQNVTFTATVSPTDGAGTATLWYAGNTISGCTSMPLIGGGGTYTATCTTSALPGGTDKIKAVYSGDKNYFASTATLSQKVTRTATTTTVTSAPNPSTKGQAVTLTATNTPSDGGGTVAFTANGHAISGCSAESLTGTGTSYEATCKTTALPVGTDTIKATYSGDAAYAGSADTRKQQVKA